MCRRMGVQDSEVCVGLEGRCRILGEDVPGR